MTRWTTSYSTDSTDSTDASDASDSTPPTATTIVSLLVLLGLVLATALGSTGATALALSSPSTAHHSLAATNGPLPVSGTVTDPDGNPLADDYIWSFGTGTGSRERTTTDDVGRFSLDTAGTVGFYQSTDGHYWRRDGITDMYSLGNSAGSIGTVTIPSGRVLDVRVVDAKGNPVSGANVLLSHHAAPDSSVGIRGETDTDGFYRATDAPFTGLELTGNVSVIVRPPTGDEQFIQRQYRRNLSVTNDTTVTVRLDDGQAPIHVSGTLTRSDGTPASGTVRIRTDRTFAPTIRQSATLDGSGRFETELPFDDQTQGLMFHHLSFFQDGFPRDGTPDLFAIDRFDGTHSRHIDRQLPSAFPTNVTVTHEGTPVRNANMTVVHRSGTGATASETFRTDATGRLRAGGSPGLELDGRVTIRARVSDSNGVVAERTRDVLVRKPTDVSVSLAVAPPTVSALTAPSSVQRGTPVELGARASGAILEYRWDFDGDGTIDTTTTESTVIHRYDRNGTVSPSVTAVGVDSAAATDATIAITETDDRTDTDGAGVGSGSEDIGTDGDIDGGGTVGGGTGGGTVDDAGSDGYGGGTGTIGVGGERESGGVGRNENGDNSTFGGHNGSFRTDKPVVTVVPDDDGGIAIDLHNGRVGVTAATPLAGVETDGVRFTRYGVTFGRDNVSSALSLSARKPTNDDPNATLAVLDVETQFGQSGDIDAETVLFSVASDSLPAGTALSDVVLYRCRDGVWRRVHTTRNGSTFSTTVRGVSPVAVCVLPENAPEETTRGGTSDGNSTTFRGETVGTNTTDSPTTATNGTMADDTTSPALTQQVESRGQPGFGIVLPLVSLIVLMLIVHERQRL